MASTTTKSSQHVSILDLPTEIHLDIISRLPLMDKHAFRLVNHHFNALIAAPTSAELLEMEMTEINSSHLPYATCVDCTRLRPLICFSGNMVTKKMTWGGFYADKRFCIECGRRPISGIHRHGLGNGWMEGDVQLVHTDAGLEVQCVGGVAYVRCSRCRDIGRAPPDDTNSKVCISCYPHEQAKLLREERQREERQKEERREEKRREEKRQRQGIPKKVLDLCLFFLWPSSRYMD